ncbi:cilia- and flagella-associated protein 47-like [Odontomachus brunneus]|uniref:cilia- and flagella-associated protein 47-like n=1 Tax=Odontomachus brunneus TaxID=486640 RepID=UPI0013F2411D|nr:cilia- and flagella-associated protein 47-like [Odontomachus brunneus]
MSRSATGLKYNNVYITPSHIEFTEALEGVTYRQCITIKNIGNRSAFIRIRQPHSIVFQVETSKNDTRLSPGLSLMACVTYTFKRPSLLHAIIPIEIDGEVLDYRVLCTVAVEGVSIEPKSLDFGIVDVGYKSDLIITIRNKGGKSTRFSIDLGQNDLDVSVKPLRGTVRPSREVTLQIELVGKHEGVFYSEFWIKSVPNIRVPIKVNVITPRLVVYHPNTTGSFTLVDFPPTIENTSRYDTFVLRNLSSRAISYVVLNETDNRVKCIRAIDHERYPARSVFKIRPIEGRLDPFQGVVFEIEFSPTIKLSRQEHSGTKRGSEHRGCESGDFIVFMRIVKVHCAKSRRFEMEDLMDDKETATQSSTPSTSRSLSIASAEDDDIIRLCLYGEVETARLYIEPNILYFGDVLVGQISQRVLRLTNLSAIAPIYLEYVPNAAARCRPKLLQLQAKSSIEVLVQVRGKESVQPSFKLCFDVRVDSYSATASRRSVRKIKIARYTVGCTVNVILKSKWGFLSKRSLPAKVVDDDQEIMKRILRAPKWKHDDYPTMVDRFICCMKKPTLERSICTSKAAVLIPLSPLQIYNIHIHPIAFVFGMVAPNSLNYRQLVARNTNNVPVMIRLASPSTDCIHFPEGDLMILPPNSTMTKLVEYRAQDIGKFSGCIDYTINNNSFFDLNVTAHVVHKQLHIEKKEIELGKEWSSEEIYRPMASIVRITNKLGARTCFRWEVPSASGFYIEPMSGSVRGNASLHLYANYTADYAKVNCVQAILKCESGTSSSLRLSIPRFAPKVEFIGDHANLGEIPLNLPTKIIAVLRNFDINDVAYEVDSASLTRGCNVNPLRGKIPARGIAILEVHLTFDVCCSFSVVIAVTIQESARLTYKINGKVSFPRLKILPERIEMKRVSADACHTHRITATNIGTTILELQFLLKKYPDFRVSLSADSKSSDVGAEKIIIVPGASRSLYLHFQPVDLASYSFYLPMVVNQLLGPASMSNARSVRPSEFLKSREIHYANLTNFVITQLPDKLPTITVDCTVAARVVSFSKLLFQFNAATNQLSEELCIENRETPRRTVVSLNIEEFNQLDCPFAIKWSRGAEVRRTSDSIECILHPGDSVYFVLEFKPSRRGSFSAEVPIHVHGELDSGVFNKLRLDGEFPASTIDVEPTEIYLTPVPLDMTTGRRFVIRARHFDNSVSIGVDLTSVSRCSGDYKNDLVHVDFPSGNTVPPYSCMELEGIVTFKSDQPVSFCSTVAFRDHHASSVCFLTVYATADNNLLTIYTYHMRSSTFGDATERLEKHVSTYSMISSNNRTDEADQARPSKSSLGKIIDTKSPLSQNGEVDTISGETINNNVQTDRKETTGNKKKQMEFRERDPAFSIDSEANGRVHFAKLSHPDYFAVESDGVYERYVRDITATMEEWMYSGPLRFQFYLSIPLGVTAAFSNYLARRQTNVGNPKRRSNATIPSFIDVLESLVGSRARDYFGEESRRPLPKDDAERVCHVLQLYDKMLDFLLSHGAYLAHISAQFLLNYDDYLISTEMTQNNTRKKKLNNNVDNVQRERLSRQSFNSRNKQCWLDVVLQTYKCFVLAGIHEREYRPSQFFAMHFSRKSTAHKDSTIPSTSSSPRQCELHERSVQSIARSSSRKPGNRGPEESFLLAWLQYHYEQQRVRDWMTDRRVSLNPREKLDVAEPQLVHNFHNDLSNGLVLIALTAAYCPFLIHECFGDLYVHPRSGEEKLHNAICLVTAWRKLRLGFVITPMQLADPNRIQMLMLVAHLFQTLPTYVPSAKIKLSCPLSQTAGRRIGVSNPTDNTISYLLSFVNNTNRFFNVLNPASVLRLNMHDNGQVQVQFHARKIKKCRAYLLFCGRAIGPDFGSNQCIVLEGQIDDIGIMNEYTVRSKLYEIVETSLRINVPYRNAAEYDIWMTEERPKHPSSLQMARWSDLCARKIPRRLFVNQKSIVVAEGTSEARLSISVACIVPKQRKFWLIFKAKTGDFIIQINSTWQVSVNDHIVIEWAIRGECVCSYQRDSAKDICPFNFSVSVPSRNVQLWRCVAEMFQKTLDSRERIFWSKYLDTQIGLRLIRLLMGHDTDSASLEFAHIFDSVVTYKIAITDKLSPLVVPECFTIQDGEIS